jgi:hypothetical protein
MPNPVSFRYFKTSPEIIQLAVMLYVRFPLSLRNVEDLLHERGVDVSYESVRYWWHRFGSQFASQINKRRAVRKSKLHSGGQITERRIHTYPFDDVKGPCLDLGACTVYRSSPQSMLHFTIYSTRKGHSQNVVHSSLTATLLLQSGALLSLHRIHAPKASDA